MPEVDFTDVPDAEDGNFEPMPAGKYHAQVESAETKYDKNGKEINLRDNVKDDITGCRGVLLSITLWSNGCVRLGVQPRELKDGKPVEMQTFDIEDIVLLEKDNKKPTKKASRSGGPKPDPVRR